MIDWLLIGATWVLSLGFWAFMLWRGPKRRFDRLKCALIGRHLWARSVLAHTTETVTIVSKAECERCGEKLVFTVDIDPEHEDGFLVSDSLLIIPSGEEGT